ncbi:sugar ABC transporter permease [Oscillochloris sp. ZM17-4]|uniref:carbohydrate ABC transporter permease n=1 Tax=Oscillochloris sp. ZM17-4 TaxID=2866714 RepID=UPI001C73267A|nr:sugar ABC transporter permease [Oscillochloris sp. ZM17-4]MBX0329408.1 sugar ABC transporter permease [Oscillochloris sp. ZM17-4]
MAQPSTRAITSAAARRPPIRWGKVATIAGFLLPAAIIYMGLVLLPVAQAVYYSFFRWNGLGPMSNFNGLANYARAFSDRVFVGALSHNLILVVMSLAFQLPLSLGLALLIREIRWGRALFRTIFFLPFVLSEVVTGVVWTFIYRPQGGLINALLKLVAPGMPETALLADPKTVLYALFVVITWKFFGYHMILYIAGLQNIPHEIEEAAAIDGCSRLQALRYITIPLLGSTIRLSIYLSVLGSLQFFDLIWVMTTGGPVSASDTMATYLYKYGFQRFQLGYGSAIAVCLFLICFGFSLVYQRFVMRRDYE